MRPAPRKPKPHCAEPCREMISSRGGFPARICGCFADVSRLFRRVCRTGCFASFAAVSRLCHGCFAG
eukprot:7391470-Prymnesium_polylepis.1